MYNLLSSSMLLVFLRFRSMEGVWVTLKAWSTTRSLTARPPIAYTLETRVSRLKKVIVANHAHEYNQILAPDLLLLAGALQWIAA